MADGSLFIGAGQTVLSAGTVSLNGGLTCSNLVLAGAQFEANGTLYGLLTWNSGGFLGNQSGSNTLTIATNSVLVLAGVTNSSYYMGQEVYNAGTIDLQSGNFQLHDSGYFGSLVNLPGGVVDLAGDVSIAQYGSGRPWFRNQGLLVKSGEPV